MNLPHENPILFKSKFTKSFLRSLLKINRQTASTNLLNCPAQIFERCDRVKIAADKSLASAVGSRKAWSRAMLLKIRNRARRHKWWRRPRSLIRRINHPMAMSNTTSNCFKKEEAEGNFEQSKKLRKLVPGGEAMDLCSLLEEAAHYVMCLNTQVQIIKDDICEKESN